ncbi:nuclear transport factor 2 family protein [Mycobacteroides abscessus]|uniref:Ketosteroid isomerase-like protein n=3 Tax=Mycobacteroides abscessus TaxID=36809 RepID=A0AB38CTG2_9MYCO|nr:nuclear transport factor 2 family protein [Mycobacteroides abscessus]ETZ91284.1 snoaL-like domain protein [Mycobacteroides abscessus MAB_030201_1075]ETZ94375.1 snoaL-like domain protein [Mycobacteroides abscessus MAB_030201_1061]AMU57438.1 ketosteroid isomerase [Mycobacteroides abscessus]AMU72089.1 ketosteroid isomerase [Mycobacteroides abscessus]AWG63534.1 ketosteroid isomerase [Mycobacteroides abscessus]
MSLADQAGKRSRAAVEARDKQAWVDNFAEDGVVQDPVGPSPFDPDGNGHRGKEAIAAFWDNIIAPTEKLDFIFDTTYDCGTHQANVGRIVTTMNGYQMTAEGVFTYEANDEGKLVVLRAYWEFDKVAGTAKKV